MIDGRLLLPIPDLVVSFDELSGGILLEDNPTAKCAITSGINNTTRFKRTEAAYGRPSGQMQFEARQASEDGGFCLFILKKIQGTLVHLLAGEHLWLPALPKWIYGRHRLQILVVPVSCAAFQSCQLSGTNWKWHQQHSAA